MLELCNINFVRLIKSAKLMKWNNSTNSCNRKIFHLFQRSFSKHSKHCCLSGNWKIIWKVSRSVQLMQTNPPKQWLRWSTYWHGRISLSHQRQMHYQAYRNQPTLVGWHETTLPRLQMRDWARNSLSALPIWKTWKWSCSPIRRKKRLQLPQL